MELSLRRTDKMPLKPRNVGPLLGNCLERSTIVLKGRIVPSLDACRIQQTNLCSEWTLKQSLQAFM